MKLSAVIFDMDGVIFDTERLCLESWKQAGTKYGLTDIDDIFPDCIGSAEFVTRRLFAERYGKDFPYDDFRAAAAVIFRSAAIPNGFPKKAGIEELLAYLKERGAKLGVASSTVTERVITELSEASLDRYFDVITGGDSVSRSKPAPDIFLHCLSLLSVPEDEAIVIEDSHNGVRAAANAGIRCIMVPDLLPPTEETDRLTYMTLPSLIEVKKHLALM